MSRLRATIAAALLVLLAPLLGLGPLELHRPTLLAALACHFAHLSRDHLLWSGAPTLLSLAALEWELGTRRTIALVLGSALAVSGAVLLFEASRLSSYAGLSGVGHAFVAAWIFRDLRRRWLLALLLLGKLAHELETGQPVWDPGLDLAGAVPVPSAHVAGALAGAVAAALAGVGPQLWRSASSFKISACLLRSIGYRKAIQIATAEQIEGTIV